MQVSKETVTPKKAMDWLKRNVNNRPLRKGHVEKLAAAITAGEFRLNGETIKFNANDDLLDGQHRLNAVLIAGVPIESYVVRGVTHEAFDTIDAGSPRQIKDVFARQGKLFYSHLAAAIRILFAFENNRISDGGQTSHMRNAQAIDVLERNPEIEESISKMSKNDIRKLLPISVAAAIHYRMSRKSVSQADAFWGSVASGEGLTKTMPVYHLRERLISNSASKAKLGKYDLMALAIKAWNFYRTGRSLKKLVLAEREEFPTIL